MLGLLVPEARGANGLTSVAVHGGCREHRARAPAAAHSWPTNRRSVACPVAVENDVRDAADPARSSRAGCSSTLTLPTLIVSERSGVICSITGPSSRNGPRHDAHWSTTTGTSQTGSCSSKLASLRISISGICRSVRPWHLASGARSWATTTLARPRTVQPGRHERFNGSGDAVSSGRAPRSRRKRSGRGSRVALNSDAFRIGSETRRSHSAKPRRGNRVHWA